METHLFRVKRSEVKVTRHKNIVGNGKCRLELTLYQSKENTFDSASQLPSFMDSYDRMLIFLHKLTL